MRFAIELSRGGEQRSIENPTVPVSAENFLAFFGVNSSVASSVTIDEALEVPAVTAAVAFLSRTMAALPLHAYRNTPAGAQRISGGLQTLLHDAPNPDWSSFEWRRYTFQQTFTGGRGVSWIERSGSNIVAIWPMDPTKTTVQVVGGRKFYQFQGKEPYPASDVIDVPFMLKADQVTAYGPIAKAARAIRLALSMGDYANGFFAGGGVPPLALVGPLPTGAEAMRRAMDQVHSVITEAKKSDKPIFPMPPGHELKPVGFDPEKGQMTEARRFQIEEIARAYQLPPVFLQDLSHGTFANTEQQDLHFVKHLVSQWAKAFEQELNLKLFGQMNTKRYVEHNLDGLMRGDFATRMDGLSTAIQNAVLTPNEARALENRPALPNGDDLLIQGATVPLGSQPVDGGNGDGDEPGTSGTDDAA